MQLNTRVYDILKFVALVLLPGFSTAYFSLSDLWNLPYAERVVGTAVTIDTLLGLILKASTSKYNKNGGGTDGDVIISEDEGQQLLHLAMTNNGLASIPAKSTVTLNVVDMTTPK